MASRNGSVEKILREEYKSNNKRGRPRNVPTEKNKLLRQMIEEFTDGKFDVFSKKMAQIKKPEMYAKLYLELLSFRMPKLKSIDFRGDIKDSSLSEKLQLLHKATMEESERVSKLEESDESNKTNKGKTHKNNLQ